MCCNRNYDKMILKMRLCITDKTKTWCNIHMGLGPHQKRIYVWKTAAFWVHIDRKWRQIKEYYELLFIIFTFEQSIKRRKYFNPRKIEFLNKVNFKRFVNLILGTLLMLTPLPPLALTLKYFTYLNKFKVAFGTTLHRPRLISNEKVLEGWSTKKH